MGNVIYFLAALSKLVHLIDIQIVFICFSLGPIYKEIMASKKEGEAKAA